MWCFNNRVMGTRLQKVDYEDIAESIGAGGIKLRGIEELEARLKEALAENQSTLIEILLPVLSLH